MTQDKQAQTLLDTAARLLGRAKAHGAERADCVVVRSDGLNVTCRLGELEDLERSESADLGLRVLIGKRQANISSTDFSDDGLDALASRCVSMAKAATIDEYCGLADKALLAGKPRDFDLFDATLTSADKLKSMALETEAAALGVKGIANSLGSSAGWGVAGMVLVTSEGFSGAYKSSSFSLSCSVLAGEGTAMERDYDYDQCLHFEDLRRPEDIGKNAAQRTLERLNPKKVASQAAPIIYDKRVSGGLIGHFANAVSGTGVARKTSFLKDEMGNALFQSGINIIDDPHRKRGLRTRPFDGEGVATKKMPVVKDGRLESWLLDCATARQLGLETTGHASRSISGPPSPGPSNLYLEAGENTLEELIGEISSGLYVTDLIGMGVNAVTGDYSRGASGFWIEDGKLAYPVSEITIAGNLKDMYRNLRAANDLEFRYGINAPSVRVDGMTIAGT